MKYKTIDLIFKEYLQGAIARLEAEQRGINEVATLDTADWDLVYDGKGTLTLKCDKDWYTISESESGGFKLANIAGFDIPIPAKDNVNIRSFYVRHGDTPLTIPRMSFSALVDNLSSSEVEDEEYTDEDYVDYRG